MKRLLLVLLLVSIGLTSCSSSKSTTKSSRKYSKADKVVANAVYYKGTRYKYGGTTRKGMDCSGLIYKAFGKEKHQLPRTSRAMSIKGKSISLSRVRRGDLLFFKTGGSGRINHVGLVTSVKNGDVKFIHATLKRGVTVSSLNMRYWKKAYRKAKRIL